MSCTKPVLMAATTLAAAVCAAASAETAYFVIGERPGQVAVGDSYILPIDNPADIAQAREWVANGPPPSGGIVFATIAAGADGINRDVLATGEPEWSWHVTDFSGFGDLAIELCDGTPTFIESDVQGWIDNTNSQVCLWRYTVIDEVPAPVPCPGDATGDNTVDFDDINAVLGGFGSTFDFDDLNEVLGNFGANCG